MDKMKAHEICTNAANLVGGDRQKTHGDMVKNHDNIARLWEAYLNIRPDWDAPLTALDVAHMMGLLKIARTQAGTFNLDDYIDMAGYASVAGEIAAEI